MYEIIDLSQEIYSGMPVFSGLPEVKISVYASHEDWDGITGRGRFRFIGLPLKIRGGTGSPVRAVAVFEK